MFVEFDLVRRAGDGVGEAALRAGGAVLQDRTQWVGAGGVRGYHIHSIAGRSVEISGMSR